jgi:chorismate mutase
MSLCEESTTERTLTYLIVERLFVGDRVAAAKYGSGKAVDDLTREEQELASVRTRAFALGLDPECTADFFRDQIEASKVVQRGLLARWTANPVEAPAISPDLADIRAELDVLTTALLTELATGQPSLGPIDRPDLDDLHRDALRTALKSIA